MGIQLVIFDLDETLVHATEVPLSHAHDFQLGPYFVYVRPFASELIKVSASRFDIAVWSSSRQQIIMLDDSPEKLQRQPAQHLCVPAFLGDPDDRALLDIIGRIEALE